MKPSPTQHPLTHLRGVLPTSTQESPHVPVPEVWLEHASSASNSSMINPLPQPQLLLLPQQHMNVQYFLQSSCFPENKFQLGLMKHFIQHSKGKARGGGWGVRRGSTKFKFTYPMPQFTVQKFLSNLQIKHKKRNATLAGNYELAMAGHKPAVSLEYQLDKS